MEKDSEKIEVEVRYDDWEGLQIKGDGKTIHLWVRYDKNAEEMILRSPDPDSEKLYGALTANGDDKEKITNLFKGALAGRKVFRKLLNGLEKGYTTTHDRDSFWDKLTDETIDNIQHYPSVVTVSVDKAVIKAAAKKQKGMGND